MIGMMIGKMMKEKKERKGRKGKSPDRVHPHVLVFLRAGIMRMWTIRW